MAQHNLSTVISFEVVRTLTKRRFWISTLIVPVVAAIVIALIVLSNTSTATSVDSQKNEKLAFTYSDASGLVDQTIAASFGGTVATDTAQQIAAVKSGKLDAYFQYPKNPAKQTTQVFGADLGIFQNGKYSAIALELLTASAQAKIGDPTLAALAQGDLPVAATTYRDGEISGELGGLVPPLLFLVIFYLVIFMLGGQMLNATLEEKENRVTEMILTTLNPTTLVVGKVLSLFIIGVVQMVTFVVPLVLGYIFFRDQLNLPSFDLASLTINPWQMLVGALLLIGGFTLFTGTLVAVGAIMPTAKEAGLIFGVMMGLIFVPFYAVSLIVSDPHSFIVQIFTYFPYSAPVTAMLRNGFGSLNPLESIIIIVELFVLGTVVLRLAVRLFRYGSIEYTKKVSLKTVFARNH